MTFLYIFTEEKSAANVFEAIIPQILPVSDSFNYHIFYHQGKEDLRIALKKTLPTISKVPYSKILITHDQDQNDCRTVKSEIQQIIGNRCNCPYLIRIVCRNLESWFLGDLDAIAKSYPRFKPGSVKNKSEFQNVDQFPDPTGLLQRIIPEYKYYNRLPKLDVSSNISAHLGIESNQSTSFRNTVLGIKKLVSKTK